MTTRFAHTAGSPADQLDAADALLRFGAGQDLRDRALFSSAFTADAELDFVQPAAKLGATIDVFRGREHIVSTIFQAIAALLTTHTVSNTRVRVDGDTAELMALVEAHHLPQHDPSRHLLLKNHYAASLRREDGTWRIARLHIENVWLTGDPRVLFA